MPNPTTPPAPTAGELIAQKVADRIRDLTQLPLAMQGAAIVTIQADLQAAIDLALASAEPERGAEESDPDAPCDDCYSLPGVEHEPWCVWRRVQTNTVAEREQWHAVVRDLRRQLAEMKDARDAWEAEHHRKVNMYITQREELRAVKDAAIREIQEQHARETATLTERLARADAVIEAARDFWGADGSGDLICALAKYDALAVEPASAAAPAAPGDSQLIDYLTSTEWHAEMTRSGPVLVFPVDAIADQPAAADGDDDRDLRADLHAALRAAAPGDEEAAHHG